MLAREDERRERRAPHVVVIAGHTDVLSDRAGRDDRGDAFRREELLDLDLPVERLLVILIFFL